MTYNFTLKAKVGQWEVLIDPKANYGYFEHDIHGEGGGLWFEGTELVDYDGVFALEADVANAIRSLGYTVDSDCET